MDHSLSLLGLDWDVLDDQWLNHAIVNIFLEGGLSWVFQQWWLAVYDKVDCLIGEGSAHIFWCQFAELSLTMVKLGFNFSFDKGHSFFGLIDPFSFLIAYANAKVDQIPISFLFPCWDINQFNDNAEVPLLVEDISKVFGQFQAVSIVLLAEELLGEWVGGFMQSLFNFFRKVLCKSGLLFEPILAVFLRWLLQAAEGGGQGLLSRK